MNTLSFHDYHPSHPWYYVRGGKPLSLKAIRADAIASSKGCYLDYIATLKHLREPRRSQELKAFKAQVLQDLQQDIIHYRHIRRQYTHLTRIHLCPPKDPICDDIHMSLSLKYAHLSNHFTHLAFLENCTIAEQYSLF